MFNFGRQIRDDQPAQAFVLQKGSTFPFSLQQLVMEVQTSKGLIQMLLKEIGYFENKSPVDSFLWVV